MKNKVVYGWFADGIPFYIGIGSSRRSQSMKGRNKYCSKKRAKAEKENCFEVRILYCNLSWEQACEIEISLISLYGRVDNKTGILTNMTDGGEGHCNPSKETRKKLSESIKGKRNHNWGTHLNQETKDKIRRSNTGKKHTPSSKNKMSKSQKGRKHTIKTKEKMSKSKKGNKNGCRSVITPVGEFDSITEAREYYNVSYSTLRRWIKNPDKINFDYLT